PTDLILAVRPLAAPVTMRSARSIFSVGGMLTVAAFPRTHIAGSWHTMTAWMEHCIGCDPSSGAAAAAEVMSTAGRAAGHIKRFFMALWVAGTPPGTYGTFVS